MLSRLLCFDTLPRFNYVGKRCCFSEKESGCKKCGNQERFVVDDPISEGVDDDLWKDTERVKYSYWKEGDLHEVSVHPLQLVLKFRESLISYKNHYAVKERQRYVHKEQQDHMLPNWLRINIDFAENSISSMVIL
jgi:hypothetical protein